jgi:hypothetical protein
MARRANGATPPRRFAAARRGGRALAALIAVGIVLPFLLTGQRLPERHDRRARLRGDGARLNVVVGFAGLLDLGYVAFYALGAYCMGWFGSDFFFKAHIHVLVSALTSTLGIHLNFVLILIARWSSARSRGCSSACRRCGCAATTSRS